jgi:hypothetical protein
MPNGAGKAKAGFLSCFGEIKKPPVGGFFMAGCFYTSFANKR